MSVVDDYGRYEALPQLLRSRCYPLQTDQVRVADITRSMAACQKAGLIALYEIDGKHYLQIERFGQQQRSDSKYPHPPPLDSKCSQPPSNAHLVVSVVGDVVEKKPPDGGADDQDATIWKLGVALLTKSGTAEATARRFLGQFAKNGTETKLAEVIGYLAVNPKVEPKAYIVAAMTRKSGAQEFLENPDA